MVKGSKSIIKATKTEPTVSQKEVERRLEEETLQQLLESSSTTSSNKSNESFRDSFYEASAGEELNIHDSLYQTDTESVEDEEPEYVQRKSLLPEFDFFHTLGDVSNLENISEQISVTLVPAEVPFILAKHTQKEVEKIASSLAGLEMKDSVESIFSKMYEEDEAEKQNKEETEKSIKYQYMSDTSGGLDQDKAKKAYLMDDTLETFLEFQMETADTSKGQEIDWDALAQAEEAKRFEKFILKCLTELINKAVQFSEYLSPEKFLQLKLYKRKLLLELVAKLTNFYNEKNQNDFLNRQVVQHFRRNKSFRAIMADSAKTLLRDKQKLEQAKEHLEQILSREKKLIKDSNKLQEELRGEYEQLKQEAESEIQIFESKVKNNLYRNNMPKTNAEIDRLLLAIKKYRHDVSAVRLSLLLQQHTEAKLIDMITQMEDLGNGLTMKSFITIQAEIQALGKKIEERSADLNKLYLRNHYDLHTLAHFKENQQIIYDTINIQRTILKNLMEEKSALRERLLFLKLQRNRIYGNIKRLSAEGGLLDKPALMYDYDHTVKLSANKRKQVEFLRRNVLLTQRKIDQILDC